MIETARLAGPTTSTATDVCQHTDRCFWNSRRHEVCRRYWSVPGCRDKGWPPPGGILYIVPQTYWSYCQLQACISQRKLYCEICQPF